MEDKKTSGIIQTFLILTIFLIFVIFIEKKTSKDTKNYKTILIEDSISLNVSRYNYNRGGFLFNNRYSLWGFERNKGTFNLDKWYELESPFKLIKNKYSDTVFFVKDSKKEYLILDRGVNRNN